MIIKRIFFTLLIAMLVSTAKAQSDDNDTLKRFLSWTIAMDGHLGDPKQIEGILSYVDTGYNSLKYEMSDTIYFYPGLYIREPECSYPYFATVFKITNRWGVYYLMKVKEHSMIDLAQMRLMEMVMLVTVRAALILAAWI